MKRMKNLISFLLMIIAISSVLQPALADSRILATGGASTLEGSAGGGIVPWAVMSGYGSLDEWGAASFATHVRVSDYSMSTVGASVSWDNRVEFSYAHQIFEMDSLNLPEDELRQNVFGMKVRLFGDLVLEKLPQVSAGVQYKKHLNFLIPGVVGAVNDSDLDYYLSATKLWLAGPFDRNVFANATVRFTRANQTGLLGFGGDKNASYEAMFEGSAGIFINRHIAIGAEYRQQPDNLSFSKQDDWFDVFVAAFPNKHVSVVAAYANLGTVATQTDQDGWYASIELSF